jgi:hypothetical protein
MSNKEGQVIRFTEGAHYYDCRNGEPKPKHDADLRVARKENLYVSPTTLDRACFPNPRLEKWKMTELALAACDNPKQPHEDVEDYCNRIYDLSLEKSLTAANFGNEVHDAIEHYPQMPLDPAIQPFFNTMGDWFAKVSSTVGMEMILVDHDLGVAGRTDRIVVIDGQLVIVDFKSQGIKPDKKGRLTPNYYDSWVRQLSFYACAYAKQTGTFPNIPKCMNVVINSKEPTPPFVKVYDSEEVRYAYKSFVIAAYGWFAERSFWPQQNGPFDVTSTLPMPI